MTPSLPDSQATTYTQLLTVAEAAKRLAVKSGTIYRLIRIGELRTVRFAHSVRIPAVWLEEYIQGNIRYERSKVC